MQLAYDRLYKWMRKKSIHFVDSIMAMENKSQWLTDKFQVHWPQASDRIHYLSWNVNEINAHFNLSNVCQIERAWFESNRINLECEWRIPSDWINITCNLSKITFSKFTHIKKSRPHFVLWENCDKRSWGGRDSFFPLSCSRHWINYEMKM